MKNLFKISTLALVSLIIISACKKDEDEPDTTPSTPAVAGLYDQIKSDSGYTYFDGGKLLSGKAPSPHGSFKLRFNSIAQATLDTSGALPAGSQFPENSIIVKDIYKGGSLAIYAVMQKKASDPNVASGWVWVEYGPSGNEIYRASLKGAGCTGCHSTDKHRDYVKTFDLH